MRKILLFIITILIFIPTFVFAEDNSVVIESITMIDKSPTASELSPAKADGTSINIDISFAKVNDYIKYKLVVKNNTDDDYVLDESMFTKKYDNFSYQFETENKTVKAKSTRDVIFNVKYEVAKDYGVYNETNTFDIGLTGGPLENPPTGVYSLLFIIPIVLILGVILIKNVNSRKAFKAMVILGLIILPTVVYALNKCSIKINSKIFIENCRYKLKTKSGTFEEGKDTKNLCIVNEIIDDYDYDYYTHGSDDRSVYYEPNSISAINLQNYGDGVYNSFPDNGYINVYTDEARTHLLKRITKKDIPKHYYGVTVENYIDLNVDIPLGDYRYLYIDISTDLRNAPININHEYYRNLRHGNYKDELLFGKEEDIRKLITLNNSQSLTLFGFTKCTDSNCAENEYIAEFGIHYK